MIEIILGLMGGLGLFLFGMKQMSDGLEKAAGAKMRSVLEFLPRRRSAESWLEHFYGNYPVVQCLHGYGGKLCEFGSYEPVSGCRRDHGCKHRYHCDLTADFL